MPNAIDPKLIAATEARMARSGLWRGTKTAGNFSLIPTVSVLTAGFLFLGGGIGLGLFSALGLEGTAAVALGGGALHGLSYVNKDMIRALTTPQLLQDVAKRLGEPWRCNEMKGHDVSIAKARAYFDLDNGNIKEQGKKLVGGIRKETREFKYLVNNAALALKDSEIPEYPELKRKKPDLIYDLNNPRVREAMTALGEKVEPRHMGVRSYKNYLTPAALAKHEGRSIINAPVTKEAESFFGRVAEFAKGKPWVTAASVAGVGLAGWAVTNALSKPAPSAPSASFSERETARRHASNAQADVAATVT